MKNTFEITLKSLAMTGVPDKRLPLSLSLVVRG